jgi:hypothetical protein
VGIFHALWHLPTFWIVGTNQSEMGFGLDFALFIAAGVSFSLYATWCYNANGRSTLAVTLLHWTGNLCLDLCTDGPGTVVYRVYTVVMVLGALAIGAVWTSQDKGSERSEAAEAHAAR